MIKPLFFSLLLMVTAICPAAFAERAIVADVQVVSMGEKDYLLRIRSSAPQAFDAVTTGSPVQIRLYQASLGEMAPLGETPFGSVTLSAEDEKDVLLKLTFVDPAYKAFVSQGSSPNTVEVDIKWAPDLTAPVISEIKVSRLASTGAVITWKTDEVSDTQVMYGTSQPETQLSGADPKPVTEHTVTLSNITSGTLHYYKVRSKDSAGNLAVSNSALFTTGVPAFIETGGQVVIEAENFDKKTPRAGKDWTLQTAQAGYAGSGYLSALANTNVTINAGYVTTSPELAYKINFTKTGTYSVWLRGRGANVDDDSIHAGFNAAGPASADRMNGFKTNWTWSRSTGDSAVSTLVVSTPGVHTFHIWMREDGFQLDKIVLKTTNASIAPTTLGPNESSRSA